MKKDQEITIKKLKEEIRLLKIVLKYRLKFFEVLLERL